jgi:hypothetical protein
MVSMSFTESTAAGFVAVPCSSRIGGDHFGVDCELEKGHSGLHEAAGEAWIDKSYRPARSHDIDYCQDCKRVVPDGTEHSWKAHGSTQQAADELVAWKWQMAETGAHH